MSSNSSSTNRTGRPIAVLTTCIATLTVVAACSSSNTKSNNASDHARPRSEAVTPTSADGAQPDDTSGPTADDLPEGYPCSLMSDEQVSEVAEITLKSRARTARISEGDITFNARECLWSTDSDATTPGTVSEIYLQASVATDFRSGEVTCHPLPNATGTVESVGNGVDKATWEWTSQNDTDGLGKLRACTTDALYTVAVTGPEDEATAKTFATKLIQLAIEAS